MFHYDPLRSTSIFQSIVLHHLFAKVWVISHGDLLGTHEWKRVIFKLSWEWFYGPQQKSDWECGFYVVKFLSKYYECMVNERATHIEV